MKQIADFLKNESIFRVLDVGTGNGEFLETFSSYFPDALFTGIDADENALKEARQKLGEGRFRFRKMEAGILQFENKSFDMVTVFNALHHLSNPENAFAEMKRVVKNNGWFIISEPVSDHLNTAQECQKLYHHHRSRIDRLLGIFHRETYTRNEIVDLLTVNGFIIANQFEYLRKNEPEYDPAKLDEWVRKMEQTQEKARTFTEYNEMKKMVRKFRTDVYKDGFQPATNLVVVCRNG